MLTIASESAWTFDTSASVGLGLAFIAIQGGAIWLNDPQNNSVRLRLLAGGGGLSFGLKLPKIGKLPTARIRGRPVGGVVAPSFFPSGGKIWKTTACPGPELVHDDFCGPVVFIEGGASLIAVAGAGDAMLMGFDKLPYAEAMAGGAVPYLGSLLEDRALSTVKAVMVSYGVGATFGAQIGVAALTGAVW